MKVDLKTLPYEPACFAGGTLVHTKNGLVLIERIQVGDWVLSKHESGKGEREYKRVTRTFVHEDRQVIMIACGGKQADGSKRSHRFVVTPEHPFWVKGKGWKAAEKLKWTLPFTQLELLSEETPNVVANVRLFKADQPGVAWVPSSSVGDALGRLGSHLDVATMTFIRWNDVALDFENVRKTKRVKPEHLFRTTVYNIEVEDFHTYYVGEAGIWVHNKNIGQSTTLPNKKPVPTGYAPSADEVAKPFYAKSELYGYLKAHEAEAKNGVFVIRSSELSQVEKNGSEVALEDLPRWHEFEEYAPGRLVDSAGERFEYALSYFDPANTTGQPWRFLAIEGRLDKNTFVDQKLQLIKADDIDGAMELLYRTALRLKANPEDKIIYQFNPNAGDAQSAALKAAEDLFAGIKDGSIKWRVGSVDQSALIKEIVEGGRLLLQDADKVYRVPQEVLAEGDGIGVEALSIAAIDALLPIAKQYWLAAGASSTLLDAASFQIADLPTGFAAWTEGQAITLDTSGAGWGWFVDGTPLDASEFALADSDTAWRANDRAEDNPAAGRLDLLTVLA